MKDLRSKDRKLVRDETDGAQTKSCFLCVSVREKIDKGAKEAAIASVLRVACQWRLHLCVASFLLPREDIVSKALLYICVWTAMLPSDENPMHFHN